MNQYDVSALGTEALGVKRIEANSVEEAIEKFRELWEQGSVNAYDYEFDHFTVTDSQGIRHIINENGLDVKTTMLNEVECWRRLCEMLRERGIEINTDDDLTACLKDWAAFVHQMKKAQGM